MYRTENDIWKIVVALVRDGLREIRPEAEVRRAYQPTPQSPGPRPLVTLHRVGGRRVGSLGKSQAWDRERERMLLTETWRQELTVQAGAIVELTGREEDATGADVIELLAVYLHTDEALAALHGRGLGILAITDIRETVFRDERDRFAVNVNFDFTLTYTQRRDKPIPIVSDTEFKRYRV